MARIAGVDLPREKRVQVGLTYVYGIGQTTANKILEATGINPDTRVKDLTLEEEAKIRDYIDKNNIMVEGDLGGGGAGIDYKNSVRHVCFPPMLFCSAAQRVKSTFLIIQNMMPSVNGFLRKNTVFYIRV